MNRLKYCLVIVYFSNVVSMLAQNFVVNGDFEIVDCEFVWMPGTPDWYMWSDYYAAHHTCIASEGPYGVPSSLSGFQNPQSGEGYGEMLPFGGPNDLGFSERSYIKGELSQWLSPDSLYYCSFYVSAIDPETENLEQVGHTAFVGGIGAYFSADPFFNSEDAQYFDADIESPDDYIIADSIGWYKIEGIFQPTAYAQFISIGCFKDEQELDTLHIFDLSDEGLYWSGYFIDNVQVTYADPVYYSLDLGNDTIVCTGSNWQIELNATENFQSYLWSNDATTSSITVTQEGIYWVDVIGPQGAYRDSIIITELTTPMFFDIPDFVHCGIGDSVLVTVPAGFDTYSWNVGFSGGDSVYIQSALVPVYYVVYADHPCLSVIDTIWAVFLPIPEPPFTFNDTLCVHQIPEPLFAEGDNLLWYSSPSDNSGEVGSPPYSTDAEGKQHFFVTQTIAVCESEMSEILIFVVQTPSFDLGENRTECEEIDNSIFVDVGPYSIVWNTDDTTFQIEAQETNWYWADVTNHCGTMRDSVFIELITCSNTIFIPSAFTPNGDGLNDWLDVFQINNSNIELVIYNRLGLAVFDSRKTPLPWNGIYQFELVPQDIYNFRLAYVDFSNQSHVETGHLFVAY